MVELIELELRQKEDLRTANLPSKTPPPSAKSVCIVKAKSLLNLLT